MARWKDDDNVDYDRGPGNKSDSPQYSRIYDFRSDTEYTNRPELSDQLIIEGRALQERNAAKVTPDRVHFFPSVGKFIIPPDNSWAEHVKLIKDRGQSLFFNPGKFVYFDKIIADKCAVPALSDPSHPDYAKYEGLRTNLAVLRNDIIGIYMDDGAFDPGDEKYIPNLIGVADAIAEGLKNDRWYKRLFLKSIPTEVASVEAVGAREIYRYLLERQTEPSFLGGVAIALGKTNCNWDLPPMGLTPYSDAHLAASGPAEKQCFTAEELAALRNTGAQSFVERETQRELSGPTPGLA